MLFFSGLLTGLIAPGWRSKGPQFDAVCTLDGRAYSGVHVQYELNVALRADEHVENQIVINRCLLGIELYSVEIPASSALFNRTIAVPGQAESLRFARRPAYQSSQRLPIVPHTMIGAAFVKRDGSPEWDAISPLITVMPPSFQVSRKGYDPDGPLARSGQIGLRLSIMRSPDVLETDFPASSGWKSLVSPYETSWPVSHEGPASEGPASYEGPEGEGTASEGPVSYEGPVSEGPVSEGPTSNGPVSEGLESGKAHK